MDDSPACLACGELLKPESRFCGRCGQRRGEPVAAPPRPKPTTADVELRARAGWNDIRYVLIFYTLLLACHAVAALIGAGGGDYAALVGGTLVMSAVTVGAVLRRPAPMRSLYTTAGFPAWGYLLVVLASPPVYLGVHAFVSGVSALFRVKFPGFLEPFEGRWLGWAFIWGAAAPAFFEEMGFRGLIFGLLRRRLSLSEAFFISSAAFAILHLSIPNLATHIPLGLYLCWLRHRSGSLHPPMLAHALHNSWVILHEAAG